MREYSNKYKPEHKIKDSLSGARPRYTNQKLVEYNTISSPRSNKIKTTKKPLNNPISGLIRKVKAFFSETVRPNIMMPEPLQKVSAPFFTTYRLVTQYFSSTNLAGKNIQQPLLQRDKDARLRPNIINEEIIAILQKSIASHPAETAVAKNYNGEVLGTIEQVTYDEEKNIQYVILNCANFFGNNNRYFAVPALSTFIKIDENEQIVINLDENELKLAMGISAEKCPKLSLTFGQSVYELYNYRAPAGTPVDVK